MPYTFDGERKPKGSFWKIEKKWDGRTSGMLKYQTKRGLNTQPKSAKKKKVMREQSLDNR